MRTAIKLDWILSGIVSLAVLIAEIVMILKGVFHAP